MKPIYIKSDCKVIFCLPDNCPDLEWVESKLLKAINNIDITWNYGIDACSITASYRNEYVRIIEDPMLGSFYISWQEDYEPQGLLLQIINVIANEIAKCETRD